MYIDTEFLIIQSATLVVFVAPLFDGLGMYILVCTSMHRYVRVCTVPVCTYEAVLNIIAQN